MNFSKGLFTALLLAIASGSVSADEPLEAAIERALPYLEEEGTWWIEEHQCVSCHHTTFFVWAKDLARQAGYAVDGETLDAQRRWVWESLLAEREPDPENPDVVIRPGERVGEKNLEAINQLLQSASVSFVPAERVAELKQLVAAGRNAEGNWPPGGQLPLQERPKAETQWVSNQWVRLSLGDVSSKTGSPETAKSSEWFAMNQLLGPGGDSLSALLKRQNADGGWSWIDGESSSPTGTGQALWAMARTGAIEQFPEAAAQARAYLLQTQEEDGHWETKSTKRRSRSTRISDFWGSAWAVIGLLESRPGAELTAQGEN